MHQREVEERRQLAERVELGVRERIRPVAAVEHQDPVERWQQIEQRVEQQRRLPRCLIKDAFTAALARAGWAELANLLAIRSAPDS